MAETLREGDPFPELPNLGDLAGYLGRDPVVLFFYPKAFTGGCTHEVQDFQTVAEELARAGVALLGASVDSAETNARFQAAYGLSYPLLSDPGGQAARALGIRSPLGFANRTTYLLGADGKVARVWYGVKVANHAREVAEAALALASPSGA